jgi:hypothetical protein
VDVSVVNSVLRMVRNIPQLTLCGRIGIASHRCQSGTVSALRSNVWYKREQSLVLYSGYSRVPSSSLSRTKLVWITCRPGSACRKYNDSSAEMREPMCYVRSKISNVQSLLVKLLPVVKEVEGGFLVCAA